MHRSVEIGARSGSWLPARAGHYVRITDVEGAQIADMFAVSSADMTEWLSAAHTRGANGRLFPRVGGYFATNHYRPMLRFVADNSPGVHDMLWRACDPDLFIWAGYEGEHPSCNHNLRMAAAEIGWPISDIHQVPDPVDWFQNTPLGDDLELGIGPAPSRAGDHVILQAEMDLNVVVTACPFTIPGTGVNGERFTGVRLEVSDEPFDAPGLG